MAETLPIPCPRRQGADERHCSDNAVTLREPRRVSLRPRSPRLSVDPTSGHRAQLSMRTSLLIGLALLAACGGGVQPPELAPAGPRGPLPTAPAAPGAAPGPGPTTTAPAHRALIAADWALAGRAQAVAAPHAMVVSSHPLASEVGTDVLRRGGNAVDAAVAVGYELDFPRSRQIGLAAERLGRFPASAAQFLVKGQEAPPGTRFVQPELARTLQLIADSGPRVFYRGSIAALILQEMERGGGLITHEDLARYRPKWRNPIRIAYRGYTIYTMPPPSGGGATLAEILNVMEGYAPLPAFGSATLMHLQTEAMRRAYIDRNRYLGDPDFVDMPLERLLSKSYAGELRAAIDAQRATPTPPSAGVRSEGTETTHYSIVDTEGDAVSCTTTLNNDFGSAVTVTGAGFLLNDEMDDFTSAPGKPNLFGLIQGEANAIGPGKRMLSAMTPSIVLDPAGRLALVLGSPGGSRIPTAVYQVISDVIDQDMPLPDAVAAPRLHHQALPDELYLERGGFVRPSVDSLEAMGHKVSVWGYKTEVNAIARTAAGWVGVADPRRGGGAAGY